MISNNLRLEVIEKLNDLSKQIHDVIVHIPSLDTQTEDQRILERVFTDSKWITRPYVWGIELAYQYATTHFHRETGKSMLEDIEKNPKANISITDYYGI